MFFSTNIAEAVECMKVLVDNNRCGLCDRIDGERVRYPCGHSQCDDCVEKASHCLLCLTPPSSQQTPVLDNPATSRARNVAKLLKSFQTTFQVDVYRRSRLSEQLKVEKVVFPKCIQAPAKYFNKRKSLLTNKENQRPSIFPGEHISPIKVLKMDNSFDYVQKWLEKSENVTLRKSTQIKRKPFTDLNVNNYNQTPLKKGISKRADLILEKAREINEPDAKKNKLCSLKSSLSLVDSQPLLDQYWKPAEKGHPFQKIRKDLEELDKQVCKVINKSDKDESGIIIDDEPIVIDDTPSQVIDKDKLAWLAVLEANKKDPYLSQTSKECSEVVNCTNDSQPKQEIIQPESYNKVPFLKKSCLTETCNYCIASKSLNRDNTEVKAAGQYKDISITLESNAFTTNIKISTVQNQPCSGKRSVLIQTDISGIENPWESEKEIPLKKDIQEIVFENNKPLQNKPNLSNTVLNQEKLSQDVFTAEIKASEVEKNRSLQNPATDGVAQVTISDSDSDDLLSASSTFEVTAEVHMSSDQLEQGVFAELEESVVLQRAKRKPRGHTPNSSDSSDKENFDPNRIKRMKFEKKMSKKRKRCDVLNAVCTMSN